MSKLIDLLEQYDFREYIISFCYLEKDKGRNCCLQNRYGEHASCRDELTDFNVLNFDMLSRKFCKDVAKTESSCDALKCYDQFNLLIECKNCEYWSDVHPKSLRERCNVLEKKIISSVKMLVSLLKERECYVSDENVFLYYIVSDIEKDTSKPALELYALLEYSSMLDCFKNNEYKIEIDDGDSISVKAHRILNCKEFLDEIEKYKEKKEFPK